MAAGSVDRRPQRPRINNTDALQVSRIRPGLMLLDVACRGRCGPGGGTWLMQALPERCPCCCPQEALEEIAWPEDLPWDEAQAVVGEAPTAVQNVDDDLERELAFYNQVCVMPH